MKMLLVALAGLAFGSAVFSGCTNGDSTYAAGRQQKTPVNTNARNQAVDSPLWVDWTKPTKNQKAQPPGGYGIGSP